MMGNVLMGNVLFTRGSSTSPRLVCHQGIRRCYGTHTTSESTKVERQGLLILE